MNQRIVTEEKLLLKTQRKLEAIHLLGELFTRIKVLNIIIFYEYLLRFTFQLFGIGHYSPSSLDFDHQHL